ncbi:MAG: hypothetical protein COT71_04465 [Candidatus Andersenbacteria bacterium CG10_big_fil_rev_8_21_14_0_10_54_11]|uniref:Phosphatidic acid phosphatase type 2/haloperoxidase domain-containing protein n=1 Tax=Candidatus Andersenbacteria bacterium CG10_big_fil_rev_8_21_14_0_10_54_11 TaxID=1974485 RepID=A0A2M6WY89_9BACT|nr:MAG: hypothetical protein COT71_04465 [Candidatus Andersenbacteria bacterium CG10_big_fil_rev_8_21_14_0_10_54_11]
MQLLAHLLPALARPSGHTTVAVALYGFITYYIVRHTASWYWKIQAASTGILIIAAVGFSRLYLGVHFLSDVLAGYLVGCAWLIAAVTLIEWQRSQHRLPPARPRRRAVAACTLAAAVGYRAMASTVLNKF